MNTSRLSKEKQYLNSELNIYLAGIDQAFYQMANPEQLGLPWSRPELARIGLRMFAAIRENFYPLTIIR